MAGHGPAYIERQIYIESTTRTLIEQNSNVLTQIKSTKGGERQRAKTIGDTEEMEVEVSSSGRQYGGYGYGGFVECCQGGIFYQIKSNR